TESPRGGLGELGDAGRVLAEPRRLEPGERRERAEPGVDRLSGQAGLRERLALERAFPDAGVVELRADLVEVARSQTGEARVVGRAGPALEHRACIVGTCGGEEE